MPFPSYSGQNLRMTAALSAGQVKSEHPLLSSQKEAQQFVVQNVLHGDIETSVVHCGQLACQHDSYRQTLDTAKIASFSAYEEAETSKSKKGKGKKGMSDHLSSSLGSPIQYVLVLSDSIFFPEGGGQPADRGTLTVNKTISLTVTNVQNIRTICVLTCQAVQEISHESIMKALALPETTVKYVTLPRMWLTSSTYVRS